MFADASPLAVTMNEGSAGADPVALRAEEAARRIGVAPKTLANWRSLGRGPKYCRLGRVVVYRLRDLESFVDEGLEG